MYTSMNVYSYVSKRNNSRKFRGIISKFDQGKALQIIRVDF